MVERKKKDREVRSWNHIILEGFCTRHLSCEKSKFNYRIISLDPYKSEKVENPAYDPNYKTPEKPAFCKNEVSNNCFDNDCPHLGLCSPDKKELKKIHKKISELYE